MSKTENRRKKVLMPAGIRNKMMAAVAMLMVSAVMLVSTTYAWFTLSTAPEVTGITTNVGANGNLEMMLLTKESYASTAEDLGVVSAVGDSMAKKNATEANVTWGNLVDLSDGSYGLSYMTLAPARLNIAGVTGVSANDAAVGTTLLYAPAYGPDGRVIDVTTATYAGKYTEAGTFAYDEEHKGVRVLGTTTDVSQRLASYRAAKSAVTSNANAAKNAAAASLAANGQDLANILMAYVSNQDVKYNNGDLRVLLTVLTSLEDATEYAETAIKNAVLANSLSQANSSEAGLTDEQVVQLKTDIDAVNISVSSGDTVSDGDTCFTGIANVKEPAGLATAINYYLALSNSIGSAMGALTGSTGIAPGLTLENTDTMKDSEGSYSYTEVSKCLDLILKKKNMEICDVPDPGMSNLSEIMSNYFGSGGGSLRIDMKEGSGVYAQIANLVGDYTASGFTVSVTYNGQLFDGIPVTMSTEANPVELIQKITIGTAPIDTNQVANATLSNTYGYAIDFGFRTNAAASNLLLQTAGVNRVYTYENGETVPAATQGAGSYMQFTSSDAIDFTAEDVLALMSAIRVAFVSPTTTGGDILAVAALDITATTDNNTGKTTYTKGNTVVGIDGNGAEIAATDTDTTPVGYKAGLFLHEFTAVKDGAITLVAKKDDQSAITALTQNVASKITVIVYLDGEVVDNTMVANASTSMTGVMNLQFSSSATLAPMENTNMREQGGADGTVITYTLEKNAGDSYTIGDYTGTVKDGYTIYSGDNGKIYFSNNGISYTELTITNAAQVIEIVQSSASDGNAGN